ncbi:MAG: acetyl-CoA carboxylase biotin carboxylase subunit [Oligoflexia bacterium]|nr:acetyl-CoA carboxylase biotin carboxylase subunit [Oligoflexia bacterium]
MFKKILIANRGEIAVRIIETCREMNITSLVIYSEPDRFSLAVGLADEAVCIGSQDLSDSYLNMEKIIDVAKKYNCEAIHPGYGFLSENSKFAFKCRESGVTFIGPTPELILLMGDKIRSRETIRNMGIPLIESTDISKMPDNNSSSGNTIENIINHSKHIPFPVMVKATAGGGGKGMRIVYKKEDLPSMIEAAKREAKSYFSNDVVYIEKYVENPRHIEFQVLGDNHGNFIHLYERECSLQRRHQKVIEETPSPALTPEVREKMGAAAVKIISTLKYTNAGTIEFLVDSDLNFYFLEMNTRIQVEHPVTEMVLGIDLIRQQILVAANQPMSYTQKDIKQRGHSIECRIYAEDPFHEFRPAPGKILNLKEPLGSGIRNDIGINNRDEVTTLFDPMISKLITWGENRELARLKMIKALKEYVIQGIDVGIPFLRHTLEHEAFISGKTFTSFFNNYKQEILDKVESEQKELHEFIPLIAAAIAAETAASDSCSTAGTTGEVAGEINKDNTWINLGSWRN